MVDLNRFLEENHLDIKETAYALFPKNNYPVMALKRVIDGNGLLDSAQMARLAALAGVDIAQLYTSNWVKTAKATKFILDSGDYRAELDMKTWCTRIFHRGSMFHEELITRPLIPLSDYIRLVSERVASHELT
jgi:hypothetical protein